MVWKERSRVNERVLLIGEYLKGERAMTDLCREFGVSRKTAYKWVTRYKDDGPAGLADRSRAPLTHPARLDAAIVLADARRAHPHWGPARFLRGLLGNRDVATWRGR
jgi:putative transposase